MSSKLAALREKFKKVTGGNGDSPFYPFWKIDVGQTATIRFLEDANAANPLQFLLVKRTHELILNGEKKKVQCLKNFGEDCPICALSNSYYKDGDKENGRKYYATKQYMARVIVVEDPLPKDTETGLTYEGRVMTIACGTKIKDSITEAIESGDIETEPYDYDEGTDFIIKKTQNGEYAEYSRSRFAKKPRALTDKEMLVAEGGKIDLASTLGKHVTREELEEILECSLTGRPYSFGGAGNGTPANTRSAPAAKRDEDTPAPARKPAARPVEDDEDGAPAPVAARKSTPVTDSDDEDIPVARKPAAAAAPAASEDDPEAILARLRKRRAAQ